jgi:hypothetical protein
MGSQKNTPQRERKREEEGGEGEMERGGGMHVV